jgi:hypothetical protein
MENSKSAELKADQANIQFSMGARYELSCANEPLTLGYINNFWGTTPYANQLVTTSY